MRRAVLTAVVLMQVLAACQLNLPGRWAKPDMAPSSALQGEAIEVTPLDAPGDVAPASAPVATPAPAEEAEAAPAAAAPPKSPQVLACERSGGRYAAAGKSGAKTCIRPTRDGGDQCRRQSDCEGMCLARSNSCAPLKPLFGCHDILQNDGRRVTLCID